MAEIDTKEIGPFTFTSPEGWSEVFGLPGGWLANRVDAKALAISFACAGRKAMDISTVPLELWSIDDSGRKKLVKGSEHWLARMLRDQPHEHYSWLEFWNLIIHHMELVQNAYIAKQLSRSGKVEALVPIRPANCRMMVNPHTYGDLPKIFYEVLQGTEFDRVILGDVGGIVTPEMIIHLRGRMWDGMNGMSNLTLGQPAFDIMGALTDYQTQLFAEGNIPPLAFETDQSFAGNDGVAAFTRLKSQLTARLQKVAKKREALLLEAGLKAKPLAMTNQESAAGDLYNAMVLQICRLHSVPPHKIFHPVTGTYENKETLEEEYPQSSLIPVATNIERKLEIALMSDAERDRYFLQFNRDALFVRSARALAERGAKAVAAGIITFDEARQRFFNMDPLEGTGGDDRMIPSSVALVGANGEVRLAAPGATGAGTSNGSTPADTATEPKKGLQLVKG